jgi:CDP-glucose 4,6-dehydratase
VDRLLPDVVRAFRKNEPVQIRNPDAVRPWQHVLEPLAGYLLLAQRLGTENTASEEARAFASGWNFGPGDDDTQPVNWIVDRMARRWDGDAGWRIESDGPHEARLLRLDSSKARTLLGWRPTLDLDTTIDWIVDWYSRYYQGGDARTLTEDQIDQFQERMTS